MTQAQKAVLISCGLFATYVFSFVLGEAQTKGAGNWHEWIGMLLSAGLILHIGIYWKTISRSWVRFGQIPAGQKTFFLLNLLIFGMVFLTALSGLVISTRLGFGAVHSHWRLIHHVVPKLALLLILLHVSLRLKKIRSVFRPARPNTGAPEPEGGV